MQIDGIGSGADSHGSSHHVTGCLHQHDVPKKQQGSMKAASGEKQSGGDAAAETAKELSLFDMLRDVIATGKHIWGKIWGGDAPGNDAQGGAVRDGAAANGSGGQSAGPDTMAVLHDPGIAAAASAVQTPQSMLQNNPYFTAAGNPGKERESIFQKIRVKFQDIAKQLTKRFFGAFSKRSAMDFRQSSLNSRQQRPKEDLRKRSRYRDKDVEIDCVLTDDSYLMDSYDRKGEYSRLTTDK